MKTDKKNHRHEMVAFLRHLLLAAVPAAVLLVAYIVMDPFKVIWLYDNYYPSQSSGNIALNPGFVATQTYRQHMEDQRYNAFIFGNSRSIYYPIEHWKETTQHDDMRAFHFDAASESLLGLWLKVRYIDQHGGQLKYALIVADASLLSKDDCDHWHLCETPPALCGYRNVLDFEWQNFRAFLNPEYMLALADYSLFHTLRPYMLRKHLLSEDLFTYDVKSNECDFAPMEKLIEEGSYYTPERIAVFDGAQHPDSVSPPVIGPSQQILLDSIATVFKRQHTQCDIIISPLYDQIRLNPADRSVLQKCFGETRVHDFSGPNAWNADWHNYFETSHYRTHVAVEVMKKMVFETNNNEFGKTLE